MTLSAISFSLFTHSSPWKSIGDCDPTPSPAIHGIMLLITVPNDPPSAKAEIPKKINTKSKIRTMVNVDNRIISSTGEILSKCSPSHTRFNITYLIDSKNSNKMIIIVKVTFII